MAHTQEPPLPKSAPPQGTRSRRSRSASLPTAYSAPQIDANSRFWSPGLITLVVIAVAFRLLYLNQPMRYDESVTYVYFAAGSWAHAISSYAYPNNHVFHTVLAKASIGLFGNSPWALRLPAFLAGVGMVPMTFMVGRRLYGAAEAYYAAAIVAGSGALTLYSTNARGYSLICLATLVLLELLMRLRERTSLPLWILTIGITVLSLWTIPVMLFPAAGLALWFVLSALTESTPEARADRRRILVAIVLVAGATAALYSPILSRDGLTALTENSFVRATAWRLFFEQLIPSIKAAVAGWTLGLPHVIGILLGALVIAGVVDEPRGKNTPRIMVLGALYVASSVLLLITHRAPPSRVWLFFIGVLAVFAGRGLTRLLSEVPPLRERASLGAAGLSVVVAAVLALMVTLSNEVPLSRDTGTLRDAEAVTAKLSSLLRPGDAVIAPIPSNGPLAYYFLRQNVDTSYFSSVPTGAAATYLVVNTDEGYSLITPLADARARSVRRAQLIAHFPSADLYRLF